MTKTNSNTPRVKSLMSMIIYQIRKKHRNIEFERSQKIAKRFLRKNKYIIIQYRIFVLKWKINFLFSQFFKYFWKFIKILVFPIELVINLCLYTIFFYLYKLFIILGKRILKPFDVWLKNTALISILEKIGIVTTVLFFWYESPLRYEDTIFKAWTIINDSKSHNDRSGIVKIAVERLHKHNLSLSKLNLNNMNLTRINLSPQRFIYLIPIVKPANLQEADLSGANLQEANLQEANLQEAILYDAIFKEADLTGAIFQREDYTDYTFETIFPIFLQRIDFERAILKRVNLSGVYLNEVNFRGANLEQANFSGVYLDEVNFEGANLEQANFSGVNLSGIDLSYTNLKGAILQGEDYNSKAILSGAILSGAILSGVNLSGIDLSKTNLEGANLQEANLQEANLQGANLSGIDIIHTFDHIFSDVFPPFIIERNVDQTNLKGANLKDAVLKEANLEAANLEGAILENANLQDAVLYQTKSLYIKQLKSAKNWEKGIYTEAELDLDNNKFVPQNEEANNKLIQKIKTLKEGIVEFKSPQ